MFANECKFSSALLVQWSSTFRTFWLISGWWWSLMFIRRTRVTSEIWILNSKPFHSLKFFVLNSQSFKKLFPASNFFFVNVSVFEPRSWTRNLIHTKKSRTLSGSFWMRLLYVCAQQALISLKFLSCLDLVFKRRSKCFEFAVSRDQSRERIGRFGFENANLQSENSKFKSVNFGPRFVRRRILCSLIAAPFVCGLLQTKFQC